jgi:hypothetical protein
LPFEILTNISSPGAALTGVLPDVTEASVELWTAAVLTGVLSDATCTAARRGQCEQVQYSITVDLRSIRKGEKVVKSSN